MCVSAQKKKNGGMLQLLQHQQASSEEVIVQPEFPISSQSLASSWRPFFFDALSFSPSDFTEV